MTTPADIDRTLAELRLGVDALGASLLELELDDTRKLLDAVGLTGVTATRWSQTSASALEAWRGHALLEDLLGRAAELRGDRSRMRAERVPELAQLVDGTSVELSRSEHVSPRDLIARLTAVADDALAIVSEVAVAWESLTPRLDAAREAFGALTAPLDGAAEAEPLAFATLEEGLDRLTDTLATDPLAIDEADVDALCVALDTAARDRAEIAALRQQATARLTAAQELMDQVERAQRDGETARDLVLAKIANPAAAEPVSALSELEAGLALVRQLVTALAWRDAYDALVRWTTDATAALKRASAVADQNRDLMAQRDELRGRLKAYQAKARDMRALEDLSISDLFDAAQGALYASPTDLDCAARLVGSYQLALAERAGASR
jgi:hypothetical protein